MALAIGMTAEEYWEGDPWLFCAYREAALQRNETQNYQSWLQGYYTYEAIARTAPLVRLSGGRADPWMEEPVGVDTGSRERKAKRAAEAGIAYLLSVKATK